MKNYQITSIQFTKSDADKLTEKAKQIKNIKLSNTSSNKRPQLTCIIFITP